MRSFTASIFVLITFAWFADVVSHAQDNARPKPPELLNQYLITLAEYHLAEAIPPDATEAEILKLVHSPSAVLYTTVRMAVAENTRNTTSFNRTVTLSGESVQIGTIVRVILTPNSKGLIGEIDYKASRLEPTTDTTSSGSSEDQLDIVTTGSRTKQAFTLGKERLLLSTNEGDKPCLVVFIQQLP